MKPGVGVSPCLSRTVVIKVISGSGVGLLVLLVGTPAFADQLDTVYYTSSAGFNYDSNVYRLSSSVDPMVQIGKPGKSDHIRIVSLGINADKRYSNQEFLLNANVTNNKYQTFTSLNYNATAYNAAWNWSPGSKLSGALSVNHTQTLYSFANVQTNMRNLNTISTPRLSADWWFQTEWHLLFAVANSKSTSSVTTVNSLSSLTKTKEWSLKYVPSAKSSFTLTTRNIRGSYSNEGTVYAAQVDSGYTEKQQEFQASLQLTGKSSLSGTLTNIKRQYPVLTGNDFSGTERGINYAWGVTGKTYLNMSMNRTISSWFDATSSYYVTDSISITPSWEVSSKVNAHLGLIRSKTDYRNNVVTNATQRNDVNQSQEFGMGWSPERSLQFNVSIQHSKRTSNEAMYEFSDKSANLYLTVTF